jgi:hypothetical protein
MMLAQATRAIAPPMLTRRTPRSVSSAKLRPGRIITTLTGLALQLPFLKISESMGNHDSKIVDADSVD